MIKKESISFKVHEVFGTVGGEGPVKTMLTFATFADNPPRFDLRKWRVDAEGNPVIPYKGLALDGGQLRRLRDILGEIDIRAVENSSYNNDSREG